MDSGQLIVDNGQLPEGWEIKTLGDLCRKITDGVHHTPKYIESGIPFLSVKNLTQGIIDFSNTKFIALEDHKVLIKRCNPEIEDVLYTKVGTTGIAKVVDTEKDFSLFVSVALLKPKHEIIYNKYLEHFLNSKIGRDQAKKRTRGMANKNLVIQDISQITVSYPISLSEQKRIVAILDEAFEGIDQAIHNTEKNLANARELFESYLNKIFTQKGDGWIEKKLGDICSIKHGFAFKSEFFTNEESKYVLLTPGSFYESGGYREQGEKTKYYTGDIPEGFILKKGDFLFAMTEQAVGLLGSSLIVPESDRFLHNQRLGLVQVVDNFEWYNDFFFHQFNTQKFRAAVQNSASGVKVRHTSPNKLGAIIIAFPNNIREQKLIADNLNDLHAETQRLETIYRQKLAALNELKQSILQKAFTGQLTADTEKEAA